MNIELLLVFILGVLTLCVVAVSIYVVLIFREAKRTLNKMNDSIDSLNKMRIQLSNPVALFSGLFGAIAEAVKTFKSVRSIVDFSDEERD